MHITHRIKLLVPLVLVLSALSMSASLLGLVTMLDRTEVAESFQDALQQAVGEYRERVGLEQARKRAEEVVEETLPQLRVIEANKRTLRYRIMRLQENVRVVEQRQGIDASNTTDLHRRLADAQTELATILRQSYLAHAAAPSPVQLTISEQEQGRSRSLTKLQLLHMQTVTDLVALKTATEELPGLRKEYGELVTYAMDLRLRYDGAVEVVQTTNAQMLEIQRVLADVHEQVLKLQTELNRIDARLRAKAERELIEKGLLPPRTESDSGSRPLVAAPLFIWPAYGSVSAGFHDRGYHAHFGVEHEGMDIAVGQGSPIYSSADGIVFIVRDGGEKGFTYVLIGHRGGYATLYGHLSTVTVRAGQEVTAGQQIGLSGGLPGTPGSGPLTSGAHLHFEVIKSGVNVDPSSVLP